MKYFFTILTFSFGFFSFAQSNLAQNSFHTPIAEKYHISSNFGEIRPSHFHAGLDYSTKGRIGADVYSIDDGYVSRVKVSSTGYGNALYITHVNGYVSVYGHLNDFELAISEYIYNAQHERQTFEIDDYLYPGQFKVKKGQVVGKSGNTGGSTGPHLHFEIRDQFSEVPINPLLFNFNLPDSENPRINSLYLYQFSDKLINHKYLSMNLIKNPEKDVIHAYGKIGFGLDIHDYRMKNSKERFGVFQIEMFIDDSLYFKSVMDSVSFDESKYLNSFVDYNIYRDKGIKLTKCFIEPNNKLSVYRAPGNGLFDFSDGNLHKILIKGCDIKGNSTSITFYLQSDSTIMVDEPIISNDNKKEIDCQHVYKFESDSFKIEFPENSLYNNIFFNYRKSKIGSWAFSDYHHIHNYNVPIHADPKIQIKPYFIPDNLKDKVLIAGIGRNQHIFSAGGEWNGDYIETYISSFGTYYVTIDTIRPNIIPVSFKKSKVLKSNNIIFKISDNLAGINDYVAYIDNKWVLFKYDQKSKTIICNLASEHVGHGNHQLVLWVKDNRGNIENFESNFIY